MRTRPIRCLVLGAALLIGEATPARSAEANVDLATLLPAPSTLVGWRVAEGPVAYVPNDLYEYLDGGAERYLSYGFQKLLHIRYQHGGESLACVTLDLFDMGTALGAFGIYRSALPAGMASRTWGVEGYRSRTVAAAWKGCVYVHAEADDDRRMLITMLEELMAKVCDQVAGGDSLPAILDSLPTDGRVPRSERYVPRDLLGHAFLSAGVLARYAIDGREGQLFITDLGSKEEAAAAIVRLRAHYAHRGAVVHGAPWIGDDGFRCMDPGLGSGTAVADGRFLAGFHGDLSVEARERLLGRLLENLAERTPGH